MNRSHLEFRCIFRTNVCKKIQSESRNSRKDYLKRTNFYFLASINEINMEERFKIFIWKDFMKSLK